MVEHILDEYRAAEPVQRSDLWRRYVGLRSQFAAIDRGTEDEIAFGKDAWVYCRQHMKAHQAGWCGIGPQDKVGLGVGDAEAAIAKCRAWGFPLYSDWVKEQETKTEDTHHDTPRTR